MAVEISFLTKDNHDVRSKLIFFLDRTIEEYRLRLGWNLNGREFYRSSWRVVNGLKELLLEYCWLGMFRKYPCLLTVLLKNTVCDYLQLVGRRESEWQGVLSFVQESRECGF